MLRIKASLVAAILLCSVGAVGLRAQEHPTEHPRKTASAAKSISITALEKAIKDQIAEKAKANGDRFPSRTAY